MSYTYSARKRTEQSPTQKDASPQQPSMDALRAGAAQPTQEQLGHRVDLPDAMRSKMESAFGADLSAVKLYESQAVADAGAEAMAQGANIAFAPGMLDFTSYGGQARLGHEISHVVSQARGEVTGGGFLNDASLEARADLEGAMAASGQTVAMPTAAMSSVSAASAAGPMQAKDKKGKKAAAPQQTAPAPAPAAPVPRTFTAEQSTKANDILTASSAEIHRRGVNFDTAAARYAQRHPEGPELKKDSGDTGRQRFLQRFLTGSDEENDAMVDRIMLAGQGQVGEDGKPLAGDDLLKAQSRAMLPTLLPYLRQVATTDISRIGDENWLAEHGSEILDLSLNTQNMSDLLKTNRKDKEGKALGALISKQDLLDAGLSEDEYSAYMSKRGDFAVAAGMTKQRLRSMRGEQLNSDPWEKKPFEADRPAPFVPGEKTSKQTWDYRSDEIGALAADQGFDVDPTSDDRTHGAVIARRLYDKLKSYGKDADPEEVAATRQAFLDARKRLDNW